MRIHKYSEHENLDAAMQNGEPMLAVISFDGKQAYMGHIDECIEHHILLTKAGLSSTDIDKYFRIIFDSDCADWTFICPPDYKSITDRTRRIAAFYKDGFAVISAFMVELGLLADIKIPKRYRRHIDALQDD
ncbi:MAG: hypothetical protein FWC90_07210 [Oscillospiraceae bacterium]|nr:hypothetical protein [Oscillospiraceae bacterium]